MAFSELTNYYNLYLELSNYQCFVTTEYRIEWFCILKSNEVRYIVFYEGYEIWSLLATELGFIN